mmetsp:Transcript_59848/g.165550  ORF Transcript_59848/g.165550 Transcript_59848/m.165550 type:complete len:558 (+) Transcript_59848:34-1707(+)
MVWILLLTCYLLPLGVARRPPDERDCGKGITCYPCEPPEGTTSRPVQPDPPGPACKDCPNIVLMLTDDQDILIGGWGPMVQTQRLIADAGMTATSWRIHTPICAPSRAELLTGRYFHNIKNGAYTPPRTLCGSGAVGHVDLKRRVYPRTFVRELRRKLGYVTGLFGKCMNGDCHDPPEMHGAFDRWFEGTSFECAPWFDSQSPNREFKNCSYAAGYGTSTIGNKTIEWIQSLQEAPEWRPFFLYFAPHAPHSPATPAPWYRDACPGTASPRTPSFGWSTPEFHNLVSRQPPFNAQDVQAIDLLARKRCQSLLSVDDSYAAIHEAIGVMGQLSNTYFLVTSDHGYNLGHHRLPSDKFLLYDHSLRIPMLFKGPGIKPGSTTDFLGTQVDLAPTVLGLAGLPAPPLVDGQSVVPLLIDPTLAPLAPASVRRHLKATATPERAMAFVEYFNQGPWEVGARHALDDWSNTYRGLVLRSGARHLKYAEYDPYGKQSMFNSVYMHELFDLDTDPYELHNIYNRTSQGVRDALHAKTRRWYGCRGRACAELERRRVLELAEVVV